MALPKQLYVHGGGLTPERSRKRGKLCAVPEGRIIN